MKAKIRKVYLTSLFATVIATSFSQSLNNNWSKELTGSLQQFVECNGASDDNTECYKFIGASLQTVYKLNDFYSDKLGRYLVTSEIASFLNESNRWTKLGHGYDQNVLVNAQNLANENKAVVAVYMNPSGLGHVALILPGQLQASGSWGLRVPNSASFLVTDPDKSFVGKGLSYAFAKAHLKDLVIYSRTY